jgi:hypothetical protein
MGRKRKPKHLKREPLTVSLPLDIHLHLDTIAAKGFTISRYVERLIRADNDSKQTTLNRHVWWCPVCDQRFHINRDVDTYKHPKCGEYLQKDVHYRGIYEEEEE